MPLATVFVLALAVTASFAQEPVPKQTFTYKTAGNLNIQADVWRAPGDDVRPAIFWIHGGALIMGHRGNLRRAHLDRYLGEGFVVVSIDYRLAPETKLPDILEDVNDAWRWVQQKGPEMFRIDPRRVAVVGHSAGGYLTLTTGHRQQPRPRALVSFYGYGDITADWYSKPDPFYLKQPAVPEQEARQSVGTAPVAEPASPNRRGRFYLYCRQLGLWPKEVAGLDPVAERSAFEPFSPAHNVKAGWPPTLLLHGDQDTDVPFSQSEQMAAEFRKHGVAHEFIAIREGSHGFDGRLEDPQAREAFERVIAFLKRHTR